MGFKMPHVIVIAAIICAGVGVIFQIVGVATNGWVTSDYVDYGLWKTCVEIGGQTVCGDIGTVGWLQAVRAFGILGLLVLVGSAVAGALICFMDHELLPRVAAVTAFVAAFLILLEYAIYAAKMEVGEANYGYSFALTILACVLALAAGICFLMQKNFTVSPSS